MYGGTGCDLSEGQRMRCNVLVGGAQYGCACETKRCVLFFRGFVWVWGSQGAGSRVLKNQGVGSRTRHRRNRRKGEQVYLQVNEGGGEQVCMYGRDTGARRGVTRMDEQCLRMLGVESVGIIVLGCG